MWRTAPLPLGTALKSNKKLGALTDRQGRWTPLPLSLCRRMLGKDWASLWPTVLIALASHPHVLACFRSLLPTGATRSTAPVKAGRRGRMQSITFHLIVVPTKCNSLLNEKAEKGSRPSLGQNMNHHKLHLQRFPYKEI